MLRSRVYDRNDVWLIAWVAALGLLISFAGWGLLVTDRREQVLAGAESTALETREAVALGLEQQIEVLRGVRDLWETFGLRPVDEWRANADLRVDRVPGLDSIAWVDLESADDRVASGSGSSATDLDLEAARAHSETPYLVGPITDGEGSPRYRVFLPAHTSDGKRGVLLATFDAAAFLDAILMGRARGHALAVDWNGRRIFERDWPAGDPRPRWWRVEETVSLPFGGEWRIENRPTPAFAESRLTWIPHYLLGAAILLSLLSAILAPQIRFIVRQSRFLAANNRALEDRGIELESEVAERTAALEEAVAELEAFNYSVSHDLRSPLSAILNLTAILDEDYRDRPLDEKGREILGRIHRSATRATALLEDLLQMSRAGRAELSMESIDMRALAREAAAQARVAARRAPDDVEFVFEALPEAVGDRALLSNVFVNLFSNALKYSCDREKPCVVVSGGVEGDECVYHVTDNGSGFDMRFVDKLFVLFERLHSDGDVEGTGVGLAMVARIVKRHGGRVWAEGRVGEGARFSFALPGGEST